MRLPAAILASALFALLAFAPHVSAAADPVGSGSATVTLKNGFVKSLKKQGVKITKAAPGKLQGKKATFPVTGGELDPTTGAGTVNLGGGLKFKAGKKKAPVKALVIDTTKKGLFAKVGGKKVKFAALAGWSYARTGFGVALTIKKLKLTSAAAKQLNKKLGFKKGKKPFKGNRLMAAGNAEEQPLTVTVLPGGNVAFNADASLLGKLSKVEVKVKTIDPGQGLGNFTFPITGGTISPTGATGTVQSAGGVELEQKLALPEPGKFLETKITLSGFYADLGAKTITVEVSAVSNASEELNLGNLGRSSIADLSVPGVVSDSVNRTVTLQNATATLQPISAKVLNAFVEVYEGYEAKGGPPKSPEKINSGDLLGSFSFTAQTQ